MTQCALSFQNVTKLSNNHSEMSGLNFNQLLYFNDWPKLYFFSRKKCFLSAVWSNLKVLGEKKKKVLGVKCELLMKFGLKWWLEDDYENLSGNLVSVALDPSPPVRLFEDQPRCPAPAAEPSSWTLRAPHPGQTDSIVQLWQRPYFSYVNHLFTSVCKYV